MPNASIDDYQWLVSEEATTWLQSLTNDSRTLVQQTRHLRKQLSATRTHLVLELAELRSRATGKFSASQNMYFTPRSLEQATDQWIAACKAERFPTEGLIADLCCGIGGDLFGLCKHNPQTIGVERDQNLALLAASNCRSLGLVDATVRPDDAASFDLSEVAGWHIDPDRRPTGNRTTQLDYSEPPWRVIEQLLLQCPHAAIKAAPATPWPDQFDRPFERQWIGSGRECKQQVIWLGDLAHCPGQHSVIVVNHRGRTSDLLIGTPLQQIDVAARIENFLCVPHAAVAAAQLTGTLALRHNLKALDVNVDYFTSHAPVDDLLLSCFEVLEVLPFDMRQLRSALQRHDIGQLEVKKRGLSVDPDDVRRKLKRKGSQSATLLIAPHAGSVRAFIGRRQTN